MATISTAARNAACDAITALLNAGGAGKIVFKTSGGTAVATLPFSATSFGASSVGVATANTITSDTNAAGGTTDHAEFQNNAGTAVFTTVSVGTSGSEINLSSVAIGAGDTVSVSSLTITVPAT